MTLLFIENRYKTFFFEAVAKKLKAKGFDVHFLIQNKNFTPKSNFKNHTINYPKKSIDYITDINVERVIEIDRQQNHFNKKGKSYFYYYNNKINQIIEYVKPDVVFGESTAFHELLTIQLCKQREILYLHPTSCRYPQGRFSFYKYDTQEPYKGSGEILEEELALNIVNSIINRTAKPDYMKAARISKAAKINDRIKLVKGYIEGESYNTPNPIVKYKVEQKKTQNIAEWDSFALSEFKTSKFTVLYPLQMQPEANIDVWGRKHRNQTQLVKSILKALPKETILVVKPNPKSKYELNEALIALIKNYKNCIALKHDTKMDDVLPNIDLVVTITGTIAIECILSNKPVITFIKTLNNRANNCVYLPKIEDLKSSIDKVKNSTFETIDDKEKTTFINLLNRTSYKGIISDPFVDANCIIDTNIENIENAFLNVLESK